MLDYNNFNLLLENMINEAYLIYDEKTMDLLAYLISKDNKVAKELRSKFNDEIKPNITMVRFIEDGYIEFTTVENIEKETGVNLNKKLNLSNYLSVRNKLKNNNRVFNRMKIGKFINRVFKGKFTDKEIEDFVNIIKSKYSKEVIFKLVEGEDIAKCYIDKSREPGGTLGKSCMRSMKPEVFDIYTKNPNQCKLLISENITEDITGRALLWQVETSDGDEYTFMDRIYTSEDHLVDSFIEYAEENNWIYKKINNSTSIKSFIVDGDTKQLDIAVYLDYNGEYEYFPYMDTLKNFNNGVLKNIEKEDALEGSYFLEGLNGHDYIIVGKIWSECEQRYLDGEVVWSEWDQSYISLEYSVRVEHGNYPGYYHEESESLSYISRSGYEYWINNYDSIYSDIMDEDIPDDESLEVIQTHIRNGEIKTTIDYIWKDHHGVDGEYVKFVGGDFISKFYYSAFHSSDATTWEKYEYIHRESTTFIEGVGDVFNGLVVKVYKTDKGDLCGLDARILDANIDSSDYKNMYIENYIQSKDGLKVKEKLEELEKSDNIKNLKNKDEIKARLYLYYPDKYKKANIPVNFEFLN
jgi:hypothetical protein